jgi:predicted branched-subunit amino acid permease
VGHRRRAWVSGARQGAPVAVGLTVAGVAFGALAASLGWGWLAPTVMSLVVFSTSAQLAATSVLAAGGGPLAAVVAGGLANSRFVVLGAVAAPSLRGGRLRRAVEGQTVVDAGLVIARRADGTLDRQVLFGFFSAMVPAWVGGTLAGAVSADHLGDLGRFGFDAIMPAFFLFLLVNELRDPRSVGVAVVAAAIALTTAPWAPVGVPVLLACAASFIGWRR